MSDIHDAIRDFAGGDDGSLGETVSSLTPGDGDQSTASANATAGGD